MRDTLHGAGSIAEDGEEQLAAFAQVVEPSAQRHGLAFVLAEGVDGGYGGLCGFCRGRGSLNAVLVGHSQVPSQAARVPAGPSRITRTRG